MMIGRLLALVAMLGVSGCAQNFACGCPIPGPRSPSTLIVTPACFAIAPIPTASAPPQITNGPADTSPTACGYASPPASTLTPASQSVLICAPAPGCGQPYQSVDVGVGYGSIVATLNRSVIQFGPVTSYPGDERFDIDSVAPGTGVVSFDDQTEGLSGSVTVTVLAAPKNDGSFFVSGLASDGACNTAPFSLVFTSNASVAIANPSGSLLALSSPSESAGLTTVTVTPTGQTGTMSLMATSGSNSLLIPLNIIACSTPAAGIRRS